MSLSINTDIASDNRSFIVTNEPFDSGGTDLIESILFILGTSLCIVLTVIGNILVILSVFTYRPLRCVQNFFIISLACADILVAVCVMPFNVANYVIGQWIFGAVFCNIWLTFDILMCTASILNLCAIALDRYYAIHDPINYAQKRTIKRVLVFISLVWVVSIIISVPPLLGWNNSSGRNLYNDQIMKCELTDHKSFVVYSACGSFFIPLFIMTFVYIKIFLATRKRLRKRAQAAAMAKSGGKNGVKEEINKNKVTRNTSIKGDGSSEDTPEPTCATCVMDTKADNNTEPLLGNTLSMPNNSRKPTHLLTNGSDQSCLSYNGSVKSNLSYQSQGSSAKNSPSHKGGKASKVKGITPKNSSNSLQVQNFMEEKQRISLSRERRAARTMTIIMGVFVLCWLPFFLMYIIFPFCGGCAENVPSAVVNFIVWLGYINSALNPVIYTAFNLDFRRAFKRLLQCQCNYRR